MHKLNCLIVEDEKLAAKVVADYIMQIADLNLSGICHDVFSAKAKLDKEPIDILFLDINLPKVNGIDFVKSLVSKPDIIFTTAYHEYAVTGFDLNVVDYLLKPISFIRFEKAIKKVMELKRLSALVNGSNGNGDDHTFVKNNGKIEKVFFKDILYIESQLNYVLIHTIHKKIITYSSLKNIEILLPSDQFFKVQKSFIVALNKITSMQRGSICIGDNVITVSRKLKDELRDKIFKAR